MSNIPNKFVVKTDIGIFQIKITNRDYITIGTKNDCVQIAYNIKQNTAHLDWLGTEKGGCEGMPESKDEGGKEIHGKDTIKMVDLGFTILKQLYPNVNNPITLRDSSKFKCRLPDNNTTSISSMIYNLLLSGQTYYQSRFNAVLKYKESELAYDEFVKARNNPELFNKTYDFNNKDLNMVLSPILYNSNNWGDFFKKMYDTFGRNTCALMHSWYLDVYGFLAKQPIHTDWIIDISERPFIDYIIINKNNSKSYTRKSYVYNPYDFSGGYFPSLLSYHKIIRKSANRIQTMKNTVDF